MMIHFFVSVLFLLGGLVSLSSQQHRVPLENLGVKVHDTVFIRPITNETGSNLPQVYGTRQCEGNFPGAVTGYRVENCARDEVCSCTADVSYLTELDVVPTSDTSQLGMRVKMYNEEEGIPAVVLERPLENSGVEGGRSYRVYAIGVAPAKLKGRIITLQYILYDVESGGELTCVEGDFQIV